MSWLDILPSGKNPPKDVNVVIEIPKGSNIKYEINHDDGLLYVDRFLSVSMVYPFNYGFVPRTMECSKSSSKDNLDAFIIGIDSLIPRSIVNCIPIGVILTEDQDGIDSKIITIPVNTISNNFSIKNLDDIPSYLLRTLIHFIKHHKDFEKNKFVKIKEIGDKQDAKVLILEGINNYKKYMESPNRMITDDLSTVT